MDKKKWVPLEFHQQGEFFFLAPAGYKVINPPKHS